MKEFTCDCMGFPLKASVIKFSQGINICLTGGSYEHIGAVSILSPSGNISTTVFQSHKDDIISSLWAKSLLKANIMPAVISVGIHYDNINKQEIDRILQLTDEMLKQIIMWV